MFVWLAAVLTFFLAWSCPAAPVADGGVVVRLGTPDGSAQEFGLAELGWGEYGARYPRPVVFSAGESDLATWPYIHPGPKDLWAGARRHPFTLRFRLDVLPSAPLFLIVGQINSWENPELVVRVNGREAGRRTAPPGSGDSSGLADPAYSRPEALVFSLPADALHAGWNEIELVIEAGSWILYDYLQVGAASSPPVLNAAQAVAALRGQVREALAAGGATQIVFAVRDDAGDEHWYANFGYYAQGPSAPLYGKGGRLGLWDVATGDVRLLVDDPAGAVRDPCVHYDGKRILFSYRPGGEHVFHLYEIGADGTGLRRLTDGPYDDLEPCWLPDGGIVFVSARARRWVNCWLSPVAVLYRCDEDGRRLRPLSANIEHDNTPAVLPDGRILYTRWEYVDRSQVNYHHLWAMNPDGTAQMVYYGNQRPGGLFIDARAIPGSPRVVCIDSPGHGASEHEGFVAVVDARRGPDHAEGLRRVSRGGGRGGLRDPWAFSEQLFLAARGGALVALDHRGRQEELFRLPAAFGRVALHEPRPVMSLPREPVSAERVNPARSGGVFLLDDVRFGRNMPGVAAGEIRSLLVLESLPKPINFTGGMDPMSYKGTFTLARILGTVPVEADGSAHFEAPALRPLFFVALDAEGVAVKRMQSFTSVQPGETLGCLGCHEPRTSARLAAGRSASLAARRAPSRITPIPGAPDVPDFPRDLQPVLDRNCVRCHNAEEWAGGFSLAGDRGPMFSHGYYNLVVRGQVRDGRNLARSNYAPRELGSGGSPLMRKMDGSHHDVRVSEPDRRLVRLWLDASAPYPGTYAALGTGMIGGYQRNIQNLENDGAWPETIAAQAVFKRRCADCHQQIRKPLPATLSDEAGLSFWNPDMGDPRLRHNRHAVFNLTRPERSRFLLAPLARAAGGLGLCRAPGPETSAPVLASTEDPEYQALRAMIAAGAARLDVIKRFDMPGFRPRAEYVRELQRYGVWPAGLDPARDPVDVYAADRAYWDSFTWPPRTGETP